MRSTRSTKFLGTAGISMLCAALAFLTYVRPNWIERVFGADLDQHSGTLEWRLVASLIAIGLAAGVAARIEWQRLRIARLV